MSLKTWMAEFYPAPARDALKEQAVEHSLRKWIGLRKENLERHGIVDAEPYSIGTMHIDASSCALCKHYWSLNDEHACVMCPLAIVRGGVSCDCPTAEEGLSGPLSVWRSRCDPEPMIAWLKKAKAWEEQGNG